jgi:hypothetical protein
VLALLVLVQVLAPVLGVLAADWVVVVAGVVDLGIGCR